jgi:hypothetical protein
MGEDEKEILAHWMIRHEYATGHGDTIEDLLDELKWQIAERSERAVAVEREACAELADECVDIEKLSEAIRARGQG